MFTCALFFFLRCLRGSFRHMCTQSIYIQNDEFKYALITVDQHQKGFCGIFFFISFVLRALAQWLFSVAFTTFAFIYVTLEASTFNKFDNDTENDQ